MTDPKALARADTRVLTADRLRSLLSYCSDTGTFTWRVSRGNRIPAGMVAGRNNKSRNTDYTYIVVDYKHYRAHRLAWLYVHGEWPKLFIDHIDGNGKNNAIANLREASHSQNLCNRPAPSSNTSGFKGVTWSKDNKKWCARVNFKKKTYFCGYFDTKEDAADAYARVAFEVHGEFGKHSGSEMQ